ncbi:MAG: GHMP kinase [Candidatus Hydrogenedentes bacterium]|nr:GHMP kinase [Candidatus Hydrogenedentota bacterium]
MRGKTPVPRRRIIKPAAPIPGRRVINAMAPIRVCDLGGWTDTWFAETGAVLNIGVYPYAEVQVSVSHDRKHDRRIVVNAENFGDRYTLVPGRITYDRHPLIEASIDIMDLPESLSFEVDLYSIAPAGASTGTSAAVTVALLGALDLLTPGRRTPHEIASLAHRVETEKLGLQCGIQDQLCSAYGGVCFIEMFDYPHASVSQVAVPNDVWWELERRLVLVYLGHSHSSSDVHGQVITRLEQKDADKSVLDPLRDAARAGKNALFAGDFGALGRCMIANTEGQAALHPALVSADAKAVIELAHKHHAAGWKVNGAGGEGGSLTILCDADGAHKRAFINALHERSANYQVIPTYLSRTGLRRWEVGE